LYPRSWSIHHSNNPDEPNEIVDALNSGLLSALDAVAPLRAELVKKPHYDTFLFHKKLQKMHRKKRKLENRFKRTHESTDLQSFKFSQALQSLTPKSEGIFLF